MNQLETHHKLFFALILSAGLCAIYAYISRTSTSINLLCVNILILGSWGWLYCFRSMHKSLASYKWFPLEYRVVNATAAMVIDPNGASHRYEPRYQLEYEFEGTTYQRCNTDLNLHSNKVFGTINKTNIYIEQIRKGHHGRFIYVNTSQPEEAFIRRGITRDQIGSLIFSVILVTLSLLTLLDIIEWQP